METWYNEWSCALWWGSSIDGVSRFAAFATTAPRLNANLQIPDPNPTYTYTGDVDSWVFDPDPTVNALNAGQFGFRSQHPVGGQLPLRRRLGQVPQGPDQPAGLPRPEHQGEPGSPLVRFLLSSP